MLIAKNVHMAFVAVPGLGFSFSRSCMARRPSGVAALLRPSMFAAWAPAGWRRIESRPLSATATASAFGDRRFPGRVIRVGQSLGRKQLFTEEPRERVDTKVLEVLPQIQKYQRIYEELDKFFEDWESLIYTAYKKVIPTIPQSVRGRAVVWRMMRLWRSSSHLLITCLVTPLGCAHQISLSAYLTS